MQGSKGIMWGIFLLSLVLVPVSVTGANAQQNMSAEYADIQSFHSIDNASLALYEGQNALQYGRYDEALAAYTNATEEDPGWLAAWYLKAYSLTRLNRSEEALVAVDRALALDPEDRDSNSLKADILERLGRFTEASKYRITSVTPPSAYPTTAVPLTTVKKSPVFLWTTISGILGALFIARKFGVCPASPGKSDHKGGK